MSGEEGVSVAVYATVIPVVVLFGAMALGRAWAEQRKGEVTAEGFLTANRSQTWPWIAWSFFSTAMGAWVLSGPAAYATYAGWVGMVMYSLSSGLPILVVTFLGPLLHKLRPDIVSLNDFVGTRFGGWLAQGFVLVLCLYNMGVGLTAEYTAMGDLLEHVGHANRLPIVILIGVVTSIYTAYGGVGASIFTDMAQGVLTVCLVLAFVVFSASTLPAPSTALPEALAANAVGYSSIAVMPISLTAATVFSDAFWQKAWAGASVRDVHVAGMVSCGMVIAVVFTFGFLGWLAAWLGLSFDANPNLALFAVLQAGPEHHRAWVSVLLLLLAAVMNESAVDSYQTGLTASLSATFLRNRPLWMTRALVLLLNVPPIIVSLRGISVVHLFLSANLVATAGMPPLLLGLIPALAPYHRVDGLILGTFAGLAAATAWGVAAVGGNFSAGLDLVFGLCYCWQSFLIAFLVSLAVPLLIALLRRFLLGPVSPPLAEADADAQAHGDAAAPERLSTKDESNPLHSP
jgi:Na+/proline symporter